MNTLFAAARTLHYASAMLLFGEAVFLIAVAGPASLLTRIDARDGSSGRFFAVTRWSVVAGVGSGIAWFVAEAAVMSGRPILEAIDRETLGLVLDDTAFGRLWVLRLGLAVVLFVILEAMRRSALDARRSRLALAAALVAAAYLGTLAWAGHAVAGQGTEDSLETFADVVHLIAAGAWVGALPALVFLLGRAATTDAAAHAAGRFSMLGFASVTTLFASGLVNAWYQVGDVPALIGTDYGRLLLVKLTFFAAMLGIAIVNRGYLAQRLAGRDRSAQRSLRRNSMLEIALGIGVLALVGKLGITVPAAHEPPTWPFGRTLSFLPMQQSAWVQLVLAGAGMVAFVTAIVALLGVISRPPRVRLATLVGMAIPAALFAWLLAVPAYPTTYVTSPVGYTANAVAAGSALFAAHCAACHGHDGRGSASAVLSTPIRTSDLTDRVADRREGDLYWWIAHGIAGTSMPGFASQLSEHEIWSLIQFLDAQSAARNAIAMTDRIQPLLPIPAPDFTYEFAGRPQESLEAQRGNRVTLLVLYTLPQSLPRLAEIAGNQSAFTTAGARVIALPMGGSSTAPDAGLVARGETILATTGDDVAMAYAMFARAPSGSGAGAPEHIEYLIDRHGYLRMRWIGTQDAAADRTADMLGRIDALLREPPRAPLQWGHRH